MVMRLSDSESVAWTNLPLKSRGSLEVERAVAHGEQLQTRLGKLFATSAVADPPDAKPWLITGLHPPIRMKPVSLVYTKPFGSTLQPPTSTTVPHETEADTASSPLSR